MEFEKSTVKSCCICLLLQVINSHNLAICKKKCLASFSLFIYDAAFSFKWVVLSLISALAIGI